MTEYDDPLYPSVLALAKAYGQLTVKQLQERHIIGYNRACRLLERLVAEGHLAWSDATQKRAVQP